MIMEKEKQSEQVATQDSKERNLRFYEQGRCVPQDALKTIKAGRLQGMSDVNPMWRMKRLTEIFGPVGFGWKYVIEKQWTETYGPEVKCFCNVFLYVRDPETKEWSEAIPGCGGSAIVTKERNGAYVNDEGYKMALTDALSIAMKAVGIGADVWYGEKATGHNESKYEMGQEPNDQYQQPQQPDNTMAFTGSQLKDALNQLENCQTVEQVNNLWSYYAKNIPALCQNNSEFWQKVGQKMQSIRQRS